MIVKSSRLRFRDYLESIRGRKTTPVVGHGHSGGRDGHESQSHSKSNRTFILLTIEFWRLLVGFRSRVLFGLVTVTLSTLLGLLPPLATKFAIDSVLTKPPVPLPKAITHYTGDLSGMNLLIAIALVTTVVTLVKTCVQLWGRWMSTQAVNQVAVSIRRRVFRHILHLPLHRIYSLKSGGATSMLREDAGGVADLIFSMLYNPWQAIVQLLGSFVVLVIVDWRLLAAGLLLLPIVYFSHRWYIYSIRPLYRDVRQQRQGVDATTTESFGGIRVVRTFARQSTETKRFVDGNHLLMRQTLMVWWRTRLIEIIWEVLIPLASTYCSYMAAIRFFKEN